jgi:predicted dehydrogenase
LRAGAHVIVEKPIALSHADFRSLWNEAQRAKKLLIEDHNYRFSPGFQELERFVRSGALGEVKRVDIDFAMDVRGPSSRYADRNVPNGSHKMPAGVVHEFLPHIAYLALRFLPEYERVRASWWNAEQDDLFKFDSFEGLALGRNAAAHMRFTAHSGPNWCIVRVHGTRGWADSDMLRPVVRAQTQGALGPLSFVSCHVKNGVRSLRAAFTNAFAAATRQSAYKGVHVFLAKTYHSLRTGAKLPVTFNDMDGAMKLCEDLLRRENRL